MWSFEENMKFIRMHGTKNRFIIIDRRETGNLNWFIDNRENFDQIIILTKSDKKCDCFMHIYNRDRSKVEMCGNAARCVAYVMMEEKNTQNASIEIDSRILECYKVCNKKIKVNMGMPSFNWRKIPLKYECDISKLPLQLGPLKNPVAVNMGNPHIVFFVSNIHDIDLNEYGRDLENHDLFPERTNVSIACVCNGKIYSKVWERGTGITESCGSGACAVFVGATLLGHVTKYVSDVFIPGGKLTIQWDVKSQDEFEEILNDKIRFKKKLESINVFMTGEVAFF